MHGITSAASVVVIGAVLLFGQRGFLHRAPSPLGPTTDIALTHSAAVILSLAASSGKDPSLIELSQDGPETVTLDVPASWTLREVRGAALSAVPSQKVDLTYTRWQLPAHVTLSFHASADSLTVHNSGRTTLLIKYKRVQLSTGRVIADSILLQDKPARLW
jgi:hypothetical protein